MGRPWRLIDWSGLEQVTVGTRECGEAREAIVPPLSALFKILGIDRPTKRDVRIAMVAQGLSTTAAGAHASVVAPMIREHADWQGYRRRVVG